MITILSEPYDFMTDLVVEWLAGGDIQTKRLQDSEFTELNILIDEIGQTSKTDLYPSQRNWIRRGRYFHIPQNPITHSEQLTPLTEYLLRDNVVVTAYTERIGKKQLKHHHTGSFFAEKYTNKLTNLTLAGQAGLHVPPTCVTNKRDVLQAFLQKHPKSITKDLRAPVNLSLEEGFLASTGVTTVSFDDVATMAEYFAPTLVQAYTPKRFEIRTFIFRESLFSMAIFSQNDAQTVIDFRNYNQARPNRCVPFQLPKEVEKKLLRFMELAELDTGSVDLIYTPEEQYVFLEVNPMGQFHWLSENCNYYLEEFIANQLAQA